MDVLLVVLALCIFGLLYDGLKNLRSIIHYHRDRWRQRRGR
jgi:hypothetical protein